MDGKSHSISNIICYKSTYVNVVSCYQQSLTEKKEILARISVTRFLPLYLSLLDLRDFARKFSFDRLRPFAWTLSSECSTCRECRDASK